MKNDLPEIKRAFDAVRLLVLADAEGLKVKGKRFLCPKCRDGHGNEVTATCQDKSDGAMWHCKRCDARGSVVDLLMFARGVDLKGAIEAAREAAGMDCLPPLGGPAAKPAKTEKPEATVTPIVDPTGLWEKLALRDKISEEYLAKRGLADAVKMGLVRFATGQQGHKNTDARARAGYRLCAPMRTFDGRVGNFQARSVVPVVPKADGSKPPKMLGVTGVKLDGLAFGDPVAARVASVVYINEGIADTLTLQIAGVVAVGMPGWGVLAHVVPLLGDLSGRTIVLCPQNDANGQSKRGFDILEASLLAEGARVFTLTTPSQFKDVNDWVCKTSWEVFRAAVVRAAEGKTALPTPPPAPGHAPPANGGAIIAGPSTPPPAIKLAPGSYASLCQILRTQHLLERVLGPGSLSLDLMLEQPLINGRPLVETDFSRIRELIELHLSSGKRKFRFGLADITSAVVQVASEHGFHPIADYLNSLKWDGVERTEAFAECLHVRPSALNCQILRRWLMSAAARGLEPGCKVDTVLILQGPQGIGKSSVFAELAGRQWFADTNIAIDNKDAYQTLRSAWIYEWQELEAMLRAKHQNAVKAFVSSREDTFRPSYGRVVVRRPRHTVFVGTTNDMEIFTDPTGNRRSWILAMTKPANLQVLRAIREQLWAEAVAGYHQAKEDETLVRWWFDPQRDADLIAQLVEAQEPYEAHEDPWTPYVNDFLKLPADLDREGKPKPVTIGRVLFCSAIRLAPKDQDKDSQRRIANILRKDGFERKRVFMEGSQQWAWIKKATDVGIEEEAESVPF